MPEGIRKTFPDGLFSIAMNVKEKKERIIDYSLSKPTEAADKFIRESIDVFNERYGFSP